MNRKKVGFLAAVLLLVSLALPVYVLAAFPAAPSGLAATVAGPTKVNLTWTDNSTNETGFHIDRAITNNFNAGQVTFAVGAAVTSFSDISAAPSQTYFYRVTAINAEGNSQASNIVTVTTTASGAGAPSAPSGLTATVANGKILLTWADTSNNETAFRIERCDNAGFPPKSILPIVVGSNATAAADTTVPPNSAFFFRVIAVNAAGQSAPSNVVQVTTSTIVPAGPAAPSGLTATAISATQVNLSWTDNSTDETGFRIERAVNANFVDGLFGQTTGTNTTTFSDIAVPANQNFFYRVFAFGPAGNSASSNVVTVTTPQSGAGVPASPSNLTATVSGSNIILTWTNNATNATNVRLERCDNAGFPPKSILPVIVGGAATTVTIPPTAPNTTNFFQAIAVNGAGQSAPSNPVQVQVPANIGTSISLTGLLGNTQLIVDNNGASVGTTQLKDIDGDFAMSIAPGTKLMTIDGKAITSLTYTEVYSPPLAPGVAVLYAGEAGPSGARFEPSLTAIYDYSLMKIPPGVTEDKLFVAYWNGSGWSSLVSFVDTKTKTVTASLSHFTLFALMANVPPPPPQPTPSTILQIIPPAVTPTPSTILTEPPTDVKPTPSTILTEPLKDTNPAPQTQASSGVSWAIIASIITGALIVAAAVMIAMRKRRAP